jgi:hypothetical protein
MPVRVPIQVIDEQIRLLKELRKLSRNPLFLETTKLVFFSQPSNAPVHETAYQVHPNWETGLKGAVIRALSRVVGIFSYREVETVMVQDRYDFKNSDRRNGINGVLRQLVAEGILEEVQKGIAGKPTTYRHCGEQKPK